MIDRSILLPCRGGFGRWACRVLATTVVLASLLGTAAAHADDGGLAPSTLFWGGRERSYILHVPPAAESSAKLPLVIALHGAGQDAVGFAEETRLAEAADASRMVVVFPDGSGTEPGKLSWNAHFCCGIGAAEQVDDIGFITALIDRIAARIPVDRKRVYATGMSNGGMLSYQLAAARPESFAAIAPVSATIGGTSRNGDRFVIAAPGQPVPVMIIHGRKDPYVLFDGGSSRMLSWPKRSNMSVADALAFWSAADDCTAEPARSEPEPGKLRLVDYGDCRGGSTLVLWEIEDGEHNWPADAQFPAGATMRSAAEEIVAFFAEHRRD